MWVPPDPGIMRKSITPISSWLLFSFERRKNSDITILRIFLETSEAACGKWEKIGVPASEMVPSPLGWVYSYKRWSVSAHRMRMAHVTFAGRPVVSRVLPCDKHCHLHQWINIIVRFPMFRFFLSSEAKCAISRHDQLVSTEVSYHSLSCCGDCG